MRTLTTRSTIGGHKLVPSKNVTGSPRPFEVNQSPIGVQNEAIAIGGTPFQTYVSSRSWCASSPKDPVIATSPAYHDHRLSGFC